MSPFSSSPSLFCRGRRAPDVYRSLVTCEQYKPPCRRLQRSTRTDSRSGIGQSLRTSARNSGFSPA